MSKVQDIVATKGNEVWSIGPAHSVYQAIEMMALKGVGALTVLSDEGEIDRHYLRARLRPKSYPSGEVIQDNPGC